MNSMLLEYSSKLLKNLLFGALLFAVSEVQAQEKQFKFYINAHNLVEYKRFLAGRNPLEIDDLTSEYLTRHVLELFLFNLALHEGGCNCEVEYTTRSIETAHVRHVAEVVAGRNVSHPVAGFENDPRYSEGIWLSEPILSSDEFFVGLYTHESRDDVLSIKNVDQVRDLRFAAAHDWVIDGKVIESYGFRRIEVDTWLTLLLMLRVGRADVVMQPFGPREDFGFDDVDSGEYFKPIPGMKLKWGAGRSFIVSKKHPDGKEVLDALNRGIGSLRESGFIDRANIAAGLIDKRTADWKVIGN